jgi:hypothetical protein
MPPIAHFLPTALSPTLRTPLSISISIPKPRIARLHSYRATSAYTVSQVAYGYGEWSEEEKVNGVVYMVQQGEAWLKGVVGEGVREVEVVVEVRSRLGGGRL